VAGDSRDEVAGYSAATHTCDNTNRKHLPMRHSRLIVIAALLLLVLSPRAASARVRLENICSIYGQKEVRLTGIGLIVGLNGTGDGGDSLPAIRALGAALQRMNAPIGDLKELKNAKNVSIVLIEATVPQTGLRAGQKIDCHVSSFMGAKSLRGGRLLVTPLESADTNDGVVMGLASGPVSIEDASLATTGKIPGGVVLERDLMSLFVDRERGHVVTLLLDAAHSSFHAASEVARVVNSEFSFEVSGSQIAKAISPGVIEVTVPAAYHNAPVEFIAQVLEVGLDNLHTQARVVVNAKTGTIIVTGEVEISPVVISHRNLTVEIGGDGGAPVGGPFVPVVDRQMEQTPQRLQQLVEALNQLKVPSEDMIGIIRELHRSGKLHAEYDEH
jgi:flagellar P-ring protein FlgI